MTLAKAEAKTLHEKIEGKTHNHEELIRILTTRSKAQLNATFNHYNSEFGTPINKVWVLLHVLLNENDMYYVLRLLMVRANDNGSQSFVVKYEFRL